MKYVTIGSFFLILVTVVGIGVLGWAMLQPKDSADTMRVRFVVAKGDSINSVARKLEEQGLVRSSLAVRLYAKGVPDLILKPGTYELSPSMTPQEMVHVLAKDTPDVWVTLVEGLRREEIAEKLEEVLVAFDKEEFLALTQDKEGMLFPDSYLIPKEATASYVVSLLTNTFEKRYSQALAETEATDTNRQRTVILASLLEREARSEQDRKLVAGILERRLELGMPLQVDATLQYARGRDLRTNNWWAPPTATDKHINSPFNTYQHPGLPPTPICNPGLSSLKAALSPLPSDNLFYIHGTDGRMHYAKTLEEHNANIQKYLR